MENLPPVSTPRIFELIHAARDNPSWKTELAYYEARLQNERWGLEQGRWGSQDFMDHTQRMIDFCNHMIATGVKDRSWVPF
jgi:hypothetical protein